MCHSRIFVVTLCVSALALLMAPVASAELIHHYKLDETTGTTAGDSAGSVDGTLTFFSGGSAFTFDDDGVTGKVDDALQFTHSKKHVITLPDGTFAFGTSDYTIATWVKRSSDGATHGIWGQGTTAEGHAGSAWVRFEGDNRMRWIHDKGATAADVYSVGTITADDTWHHLAFVREGATMSMYIDGSFENSSTDSETFDLYGEAGTQFGEVNPAPGYDRSFDGALDDIQVYDQALTSGEVASLYNNPGAVIPEPSSFVLAVLGLLGLPFVAWRRWRR